MARPPVLGPGSSRVSEIVRRLRSRFGGAQKTSSAICKMRSGAVKLLDAELADSQSKLPEEKRAAVEAVRTSMRRGVSLPTAIRLATGVSAEKAAAISAKLIRRVTAKAAGFSSSDPVLALSSGLSAPFATDTGNRVEALGRGSLLGTGLYGGTRLGAGIGHALAEAMGAQPDSNKALAGILAGMLAGGGLGYGGAKALIGKPSWKTTPKQQAEDDRDRHKAGNQQMGYTASSAMGAQPASSLSGNMGSMTGSPAAGMKAMRTNLGY